MPAVPGLRSPLLFVRARGATQIVFAQHPFAASGKLNTSRNFVAARSTTGGIRSRGNPDQASRYRKRRAFGRLYPMLCGASIGCAISCIGPSPCPAPSSTAPPPATPRSSPGRARGRRAAPPFGKRPPWPRRYSAHKCLRVPVIKRVRIHRQLHDDARPPAGTHGSPWAAQIDTAAVRPPRSAWPFPGSRDTAREICPPTPSDHIHPWPAVRRLPEDTRSTSCTTQS